MIVGPVYKIFAAEDANKKAIDEINGELLTLRAFATANSQEEYFSNLFGKRVERSDNFSGWGGKSMPLEQSLKTMDLLRLQDSQNLADKILVLRHLDSMIMRNQRDYSDILNAIEGILRNVRIIPNDALISLVEAESRFLDTRNPLDCSPTILAYSKCLELLSEIWSLSNSIMKLLLSKKIF